MIGQMVGRYRVLSLLGRGGMGEVWKAEDTLLGHPVALKFLPERFDDDDRVRFVRGLQAAASLDHPSIARVLNYGELEGRPYGVLSFVDGATVAHVIDGGPMPLPEALRIVIACARALGHAHAFGVTHRDVKSSNIMITRDGRVVLVDFGLAWKEGMARVTRSREPVGTAAYLSPEGARGSPQDARSDLYSLGVVLYELLTGTTPFHADNEYALLRIIETEPAPAPGTLRAGLPADLEAIVLRLLEKDPARRPRDADSLVASLESMDGTPPSHDGGDRPLGDQARTARMPDRKYVLIAPFRVLALEESPEIRLELIAAGLEEAVSIALGKLPRVRVFTLDEPEEPGRREAVERTGANLLLEGSLQRSGGTLRMSWRLIQPASGMQLAANSIQASLAAPWDMEAPLVHGIAVALGEESPDSLSTAATRPLDPAAREHFLQALGHLRRHENEASVNEAIATLEQLVDQDAGVATYLAALARACLQKHRLTSHAMWLDRAAAACERALTFDPEGSDVLWTLGDVRNATGQHEAAEQAFRRALGERSDQSELWIGLSTALERQGRIAEAEHAARRAVQLRPNDWSGYSRLGVILFRASRYDDAVAVWTEAARLSPDNHRVQYNLGAAYFRADRLDEAIVAYRRSIEIRPTAPACGGYGSVLYYLGRYEEAAQQHDAASRLTPLDPVVWGNLGSTLLRIPGREQEARSHLERAVALIRRKVEVNPMDAEAQGQLGNWLAHLGELEEARDWIARALELTPEDGAQMIRAAYVDELLKNRSGALAGLRKARTRGYGFAAIQNDPVLGPLVPLLDQKSEAP